MFTFAKRAYSVAKQSYSSAAKYTAPIANSTLGKAGIQSAGMMVGVQYKNGVSQGFLGRLGPKGIRGGFNLSLLGPAFTALAAYQGYKQGGITGAVTNAATEVAYGAAFDMALKIALGPVAVAVQAAAATGYAGYRIGEAAQKTQKRFQNLEMGADFIDNYGTVATMRQRSLQALNSSRINGRIGLGNEASLIHRRR